LNERPGIPLVDPAALADAGDHILQDAPFRHVIEHVPGRDRRHTRDLRHVGYLAQTHRVARTAA
jgi:hypothetical protein